MAQEECPRCGGTGYIVQDRGGLTGAVQCECVLRHIAESRVPRANIPEKYAGVSFESFVIGEGNPIAQRLRAEARVAVKRYANEWVPGQRRSGLLILGDHGAGKTHLAVAAFKTLLARGFDGSFFDFQNLLDLIQNSWNPEAGIAERSAYSRAMETPVLLLDDLGARRSVEWVEDTVTAIVTCRYNNNLPVIATSNLPLDTMVVGQTAGGSPRQSKVLSEVIGRRAVSRLTEMCRIVSLFGIPDYRVTMKD